MIINLNKRQLTVSFLLLLFIFSSCEANSQKYYYEVYNGDNTIEAYIIKEFDVDTKREEISFMFSLNGVLKSKTKDTFIISNNGMKKSCKYENNIEFKPYLNIGTNDCIVFKYPNNNVNSFASTSICFIGKEDLNIKGKEYSGVYKFKKELGDINSVVTFAYYDSDFILIMEEFIEGGRPYFRIERTNSVLNFEIPVQSDK